MKIINISFLLFTIFFILYLAIGYFFAIDLQVYHNDAVARTALSFFTVLGRDPHLAAVGFVWQPLPSLIQVPLILLLKPLGLMMLSGPIITALSGALSVVIIYHIGLLLLSGKKLFSTLTAALFGLNPMIALYSTIGTSEMIFCACLLGGSYFLIKWFNNSKHAHLLLASFFISLSFWSRYESIIAFGGCVVLLLLKSITDKVGLKKIESTILLFSVPFIYSVLFWIVINWLIMKDPFYFLDSPYSNSSFTNTLKSNLQNLDYSYHSVGGSILYVLKRVISLSPILAVLPLALISFKKSAKEKIMNLNSLLFLVLPYISILFFHIYLLYKGESEGWLRFYIYAIIAGTLLALFLIRKGKKYVTYLIFILLLSGSFMTAYTMNNPSMGKEEQSFIKKLLNHNANLPFSSNYIDQKNVASLMNATQGKILVDTTDGFGIPLFSKDPTRYVITSDVDYLKIVKNYSDYVQWIIVPTPTTDDRGQNKIYYYYPHIWSGDAPHLVLFKQIDGWRIFKITKNKK